MYDVGVDAVNEMLMWLRGESTSLVREGSRVQFRHQLAS